MKRRSRTTRLTVEKCLCLSAVNLRKDGVFTAFPGSLWMLRFSASGCMEFEVMEAPGCALALCFGRQESGKQWIRVTTTKPFFGGLRHWFKCPMVSSGVPCGRRVGRLYLPSGRAVFGCRNCYDLTYESAQTHNKRIDKLRRDPFALMSALYSGRDTDTLLGIKAYIKMDGAAKKIAHSCAALF